MFKKNYALYDKAISMNTVKKQSSRPSVKRITATDWLIGRCLKWCLMYSRDLYNIINLLYYYKAF